MYKIHCCCSPNAFIVVWCIIIADYVVKLVPSAIGQLPVEDIKPAVGIFHSSSLYSLTLPPYYNANVNEGMETAESESCDCSCAGEFFRCDVVVC